MAPFTPMVEPEMEWVGPVGAAAQGQMVTETKKRGEEQRECAGLGVRGPTGYPRTVMGQEAAVWGCSAGSFKLVVPVGPSATARAWEVLGTSCSSLCYFCPSCTYSSLFQKQTQVFLRGTLRHSQL